MAREYFRQPDIFPTITALISVPDTVAGGTWRCVIGLLGMTFDNRADQAALISAVIAAAFGGDTTPNGVVCRLLADAYKADYQSGFDPRQTPLGSICFELQFDGSFTGMTDVPIVFTCAGIATDAPADNDITLPTITPNTTDITLKDFQGGTLPGGFYSEAITVGGDMLKSIYDTDNSGVVDAAESVPWAGIPDPPTEFTPSAHAASHADGGADEIAIDASQITTGVIDAARLPSYVDDVLEYANLAAFPVTGETGKIYIAQDTNLCYRWSGSAYVQVGGDDVVGIPAGGTTGQVLKKDTGTDYDVIWDDEASGADGSGYVAKSVAGAVDVTLTEAESQNGNIKLTGAITANINVIPFDATMRMWRIYNETSGAFTVTFKTAAGTGIAITQGAAALLECDGTNVVEISTGGASAISDLTDVTITTPSTGQALKWDGTAWINSTIATGAVNFIGFWATSTSYAADDGVSNNGSSYVCISPHTSSATDEPGVGVNTATYWMLLAAKGDPGADGADGTNGTNGTNGSDGAGYGGTSTTSLLIGAGSKAFTTQAGLAYVPGSIVKAVSDANAANWMQGEVTGYSGTTLTINVDTTGGSGTLSDWSFTIAGVDGADGDNTISVSDGTTTTSNVDTIEFDGATVTDNTNGSVTVSGFSGGGGGSVDIRDVWLFA